MRRALIVLGALGLLVVAALAVYALTLGDTATPVDRADLTVATSGSAPGDPGVYVYETSGFEAIDALSGARHDYPAETYLTITDGECGPTVRWDSLAERWISWEHCGPELAVTRMQGLHQWFGVPDLEDEVCPEPLPLVPITESIVPCTAGDTIETYRITLVGRDPLVIGGTEVMTDHVRITSELSGGSTGSTEADLWVLPGSVLVVRTTVERHTVTPSRVGDVHYDEEYTLTLTSLEPSL